MSENDMDTKFTDALEFAVDSVYEKYGEGLTMLHSAHLGDGCVCMVYEAEGNRWYHAVSLPGTKDALPQITITREYGCIPQRYADPALWGDYYEEVYTDVPQYRRTYTEGV